jgi:hypothetical protein
MLELPRWNTVIEQHVELAKSAVLAFWEAEPAPNVAQKVGSGVEQSSFGTPVPGCHLLAFS